MVAEIKPIITIAHAAFAPERSVAFEGLVAELEPQCREFGVPLFIYHDHDAKGSLGPWLRCLEHGAAYPETTHVTFLPDDAILCPHFVKTLLACIKGKPEAILCFQSNHLNSPKVKAPWYTTVDGFTAFGGTMPKAWAAEHLAWRETAIEEGLLVQGDEGVNLWAMATGRLIYKSVPSLVDHDTSMPSKDGNDHHETMSPRRSLVFWPGVALQDVDWSAEPEHLGRTYKGNHWSLVRKLRPEVWDVERMYTAERGGIPVSPVPAVCIVRPTYRESHDIVAKTEPSREAVKFHLGDRGIPVGDITPSGDSLVARMRQRAMHIFMKTEATHLLFWDSDVECLNPECVYEMLQTGHDVIGGAYPFKAAHGRVVVNFLPETLEAVERGETVELPDGCLPVQDLGTGFMLISRKAIAKMMQAFPRLMHLDMGEQVRGEPLWALLDTGVVDGVYLSEDYYFCRLWQSLGGKVYVYAPAKFRHYGLHGFEGGIEKHFELGVKT